MEAWQHNTQTALGDSQFVRTLAANSHHQARDYAIYELLQMKLVVKRKTAKWKWLYSLLQFNSNLI